MKTPKSASKPEKGGSALSTPTSGKITKNKSTPMSLKAKVLEKNAKLALLKSQDTINLNGKSPKNVGTPKKGGSPQNGGPKKGGSPGTPKGAGKKPQNQKSPSPNQNGTAGKKRKSLEGTPANVVNAGGKKSKKSPDFSPEVKLGLKIEKLLESPKEKKADAGQQTSKAQKKKKGKKPAQSAGGNAVPGTGKQSPSPGNKQLSKKQKQAEAKKVAQSAGPKPGQVSPASPGSAGKKNRRQRQKEAKLRKNAQSPGQQAGPPVDGKKKKLQQKVEAKKLGKKDAQLKKKGSESQELSKAEKLKNKKAKSDKKRERRLSRSANESRDGLMKEVRASSNAPGEFPSPTYAETAIGAILEDEKERKTAKPGLLGEASPILAVVDFFYHPPARANQRIVLPNAHLCDNPDVIFIATDMKKAKNDPDESIDHHTNLFKTSGVSSISEILPLRKIMKEHTQLEEKRKLVNRADVLLIDSRIAHRVSSLLPKKFLQKKIPIPVRTHLKPNDLKKEIATALKKTTVTLRENSLCLAVRIGHAGMKKAALVENLTAVATALSNEKFFPGGQPNVRQIYVKTIKSDAYPVYISCVPRSKIPQPKAPLRKKKEIVEGEVTTAGVTVAVHPSGKIVIKSKDADMNETEHDTSPKKKKKAGASNEDSDEDIDDSDLDDADSDDDLDPAEVEEFLKANKADDDDDEDDSEEEGGEIEKAEQEFLLQLRKQQDALEAEAQKRGKQGGKKETVVNEDESDEDDEEEDEDDEEDESLDEEEEDDEDESDDAEVPTLVPAKGAQKGRGGKPGQNGLQAKGKPIMAQKGKPNAAQKRGAFQKNKGSPKAKRR